MNPGADSDSWRQQREAIHDALQPLHPRHSSTRTVDPEQRSVAAVVSDSIPGYEISREIHRGGQGVVYQAMQKSTQRVVAIKVLREGVFAGAADRARFEREVHILGALRHPSIVTVHDSGSAGGMCYYVMDYIRGKPLDQAILDLGLRISDYGPATAASVASPREGERHGSRSRGTRQVPTRTKTPKSKIDALLRLFLKICDALNAAHLRGIIHRDLKPGNICVTPDGEPHILDFGLAKVFEYDVLAGDGKQAMTQTGQFVGSLPWASPEQARGLPDQIDARTDVYSLGVILYEMTTAQFPYGVTGGIHEVLDHILSAEPVRPRSVQPAINDEVETIILKCLSKEPERRYQSAGDLARDVRHYLAGEPIEAKRDSGWYVLKKTLHRFRIAASIAAAFVLLSGGATVVSTALWARAAAAEIEQSRARQDAEKAWEKEKEQRLLAEVNEQRAIDEADRADRETAAATKHAAKADSANKFLNDMLAKANRGEQKGNPNVTVREVLDAAAAELAEGTVKYDPEVEATVSDTMGKTYLALGLHAQAEPLLRGALQQRRRALGDENSETLTSINNLAVLLLAQGNRAEAERYYREALGQRRRMLGDEHPQTLNSINEMGAVLQSQGKLTQAENYFREALAKLRRVLGDDDPITLRSINNMGDVLHAQGKLAEAEPYYHEALERRRHVLGVEHPDTLDSISNMGTLLRDQGKPAEAEPYALEALEKYRRILGDEHPYTLIAIKNVGFLLRILGRPVDAVPYCREALETSRRVLGDEHPETLNLICETGVLLQAQQKPSEAEQYIREALEKQRRVLGDDHLHTLNSIVALSYVLQTQGRLAEAEPYCREALEKYRRLFGDEHPNTLNSKNEMGALLKAQGKLSEAEPYFREALEQRRRVLGSEHPDTLNSINNMGALLHNQGKLADAEPYYRGALEKQRRVLGNEHPQTLNSIINMGDLLQARGKLAEAEPYLREALQLRRRLLGDEHLHALVSINNMGVLLRDQGKPVEAEPYFREALSGRSKILGAERWETAVSQMGLGMVLGNQARNVEAEMHLLAADRVLRTAHGAPPTAYGQCLRAISKLYSTWQAAELDDVASQRSETSATKFDGGEHGAETRARMAAEWRARLEAWQASTQPSGNE